MNKNNQYGGVVVAWLGCEKTIELVDWTPLYNRSIIYIVDSATFDGDISVCLRCMERVCQVLVDNGCRIRLCHPML